MGNMEISCVYEDVFMKIHVVYWEVTNRPSAKIQNVCCTAIELTQN